MEQVAPFLISDSIIQIRGNCQVDSGIKDHALSHLTYGLYVITAASGEKIAASTVTWLSQASFNPPQVMIAVRRNGSLHDVLQTSEGLVVHIVAQDQQDFAAAFLKPVRQEQGMLNGYAFDISPSTGAPILRDAPAWFEACVVNTIPGGDHTVFLAEVTAESIKHANAKPLALRDTPWKYRR
jgi:flavin reductase (DIM6/NTAB) family NADH-FMN oxidoreductase RutF